MYFNLPIKMLFRMTYCAPGVYAVPAFGHQVAVLQRPIRLVPSAPPAESSAWLDVSATDLSLLPERRWRSRCSAACGFSPSETPTETYSDTRSSSRCGWKSRPHRTLLSSISPMVSGPFSADGRPDSNASANAMQR